MPVCQFQHQRAAGEYYNRLLYAVKQLEISPISVPGLASFFPQPVLFVDFVDVLDFFRYRGLQPDLAFFRCSEAARAVRPVN